MKQINFLSIIFILMFVIQPVSAENKLISQPSQNHSFSFLDSSYTVDYTMETDSLATWIGSIKRIEPIDASFGSCSLSTNTPNWERRGINHSGTKFTADLRSGLYLGILIDTDQALGSYSNDLVAFDVDTEFSYFCFKVKFTFGYIDGPSVEADELLVKVYEAEVGSSPVPENDGLLAPLTFNFLSLLVAFPILIIFRRTQQ